MARFILETDHPSGTNLDKERKLDWSSNLSAYKYSNLVPRDFSLAWNEVVNTGKDSPSSETNHCDNPLITRQDGWSVCLPVFIHRLPFFAQVRSRRRIRLQYESDHSVHITCCDNPLITRQDGLTVCLPVFIHRRIIRRAIVLYPSSSQTDDPSLV